MQKHILQAIANRTFVLDAHQDNGITSIILQCTPYIDVTHRTIYINYYEGGNWYNSSLPFQTKEIEALNRRSDWNQLEQGRIQSNILNAVSLVDLNRKLIDDMQPPIYRTEQGLIGIFINEQRWFELFDTARRCNDLQKVYILERHNCQKQPCASLDSWRWNDTKDGKSVWALHKACMEDTLFI